MEFYYHLIKWDGEVIKVKPENAEFIRASLKRGSGFIVTPVRSIAVKDVKDFRESSERYTDQKLLEGSAQAFNEPVIEGDAVMCKWVKKAITKREWEKYYHPTGYRLLGEQDNYVLIAMRLPIHQIDYQRVLDCSPEEILKLGGRGTS